MSHTFRLTYLALLTAISLSLFVLEGMLPIPFLAPGAKLGLANIVTVFALYTCSAPEALLVLCLRVGLASLFGGGPTVFLYSLAGGLLSFAAMLLLQRTNAFSLPAVSAAGGLFHHLGQLFAALAMTGTPALLTYLAILGPIGMMTGLATGCAAASIFQRIKKFTRSLVPSEEKMI